MRAVFHLDISEIAEERSFCVSVLKMVSAYFIVLLLGLGFSSVVTSASLGKFNPPLLI